MPRLTCQVCKSEFESRRHNVFACSTACRQKATKRRPAVLPDRACAACGASFTPKRLNSFCCSKFCQTKRWHAANPERCREHGRCSARRKAATKREAVKRSCARCDKPIVGRSASAKFCSRGCCEAAFSDRNRANRAEYLRDYKRQLRAAAPPVPDKIREVASEKTAAEAAPYDPANAERLADRWLAGREDVKKSPEESELLKLFFDGKPGSGAKHVLKPLE